MAEALVKWTAEYNLGVEEIDNQHRALVDLVNQVWESIVFRADRAKVLGLVEQLERYTVAHFAAEEAYMQAIRYPGLEEHQRLHQQFIARVDAEKKSAIQGGQLTLGLVNFLKQWLLDHILGADKAFARYASKAELARTEAYEGAATENENADSLLKRIFKRFF